MIRLLDLFPLSTGVLCAFGAGCCALRQMHTTIDRQRTREVYSPTAAPKATRENSCLRASVVNLFYL